ncbi:MAG: hypothetical protein LBR64_00495 [Dysgonamonadaceae bacterium]|jgi:hypothetical protein|nr:hypothetical protein [Dysgonamonadaceae bacterium]
MKTNNFFDFRRFGRLLAADFRLNGKRYLFFALGALVGIYLIDIFSIINIYNMPFDDSLGTYIYMPVYSAIFFLSMLIIYAFAGSSFPAFSDKNESASYLLLPASHFEKFLAQFVIYIAGGIVMLFIFFWIDIHLARLTVAPFKNFPITPFSYKEMFIDFIKEDKSNFVLILISTAVGIFLFSVRLFFGKYALTKGVASLFGFIFLLFCLLCLFTQIFYPKTANWEVYVFDYRINGIHVMSILMGFFALVVILFSLPIAYYKLKDKHL